MFRYIYVDLSNGTTWGSNSLETPRPAIEVFDIYNTQAVVVASTKAIYLGGTLSYIYKWRAVTDFPS